MQRAKDHLRERRCCFHKTRTAFLKKETAENSGVVCTPAILAPQRAEAGGRKFEAHPGLFRETLSERKEGTEGGREREKMRGRGERKDFLKKQTQ
jgi:hypothetical protein